MSFTRLHVVTRNRNVFDEFFLESRLCFSRDQMCISKIQNSKFQLVAFIVLIEVNLIFGNTISEVIKKDFFDLLGLKIKYLILNCFFLLLAVHIFVIFYPASNHLLLLLNLFHIHFLELFLSILISEKLMKDILLNFCEVLKLT